MSQELSDYRQKEQKNAFNCPERALAITQGIAHSRQANSLIISQGESLGGLSFSFLTDFLPRFIINLAVLSNHILSSLFDLRSPFIKPVSFF